MTHGVSTSFLDPLTAIDDLYDTAPVDPDHAREGRAAAERSHEPELPRGRSRSLRRRQPGWRELIAERPVDAEALAIEHGLRRARELLRPSPPVDPELRGTQPSPAQVRENNVATARLVADARARLRSHSIPLADVAARLNRDVDALRTLIDQGGLITFEDDLVPSWQLTDEGVVPHVAQVARLIPGGPLTVSRWMMTPHAELDGRCPRDALAAGDVEAVKSAALGLIR